MIKQKVYIETSVISYLTSKPSRDLIIAAHQQITYDWWNTIKPNAECYISQFVIDEIQKGDSEAAQFRLKAIENLLILEVNDNIKNLAKKYQELLNLPEKSKLDAFHLAIAVIHRIDYLMSWNCKHIAAA